MGLAFYGRFGQARRLSSRSSGPPSLNSDPNHNIPSVFCTMSAITYLASFLLCGVAGVLAKKSKSSSKGSNCKTSEEFLYK